MYGEFSYIYDKLSFDIEYEKYADNIKALAKKYGINNNNMLELACGSGMLTQYFFDDFDRIDALESILGSASDSDSVIDRLGDLEAKHAADVTNIYNTINNIKQDDDSPIQESDIVALFPQA